MSPSPLLEIQRIESATTQPNDAELLCWVEAALTGAGNSAEVELVIRIVGEDEIRVLNRDYRDMDTPTNVLSFPFEAPPQLETGLIGDLVICAPIVVREAVSQGKTASAHWSHMVVHGVLHLLGHDHMGDEQAQKMEGLEVAILGELGFKDPYVL